MQKSNKWSILIWSIFLSLIISLSFIFVSTKVNQSIRLNSALEQFFDRDNKVINLINSGSLWDIWNNEFLVSTQNLYTIKKQEKITLTFSWITVFTGTIKLESWWPIFYEIISYSWANSTFEYSTVFSWVISSINLLAFTWFLSNSYNRANLSFVNVGGLSSFIINSDKVYTWAWKRYKILKNIGWKNIEESVFEVWD